MPKGTLQERFFAFCALNHRWRSRELQGTSGSAAELFNDWRRALDALTKLYPATETREVLALALADPYFPISMFRKLNVEEFRKEPRFVELTEAELAKIITRQLWERAKVFVSIRQDLARLNTHGQLSTMRLENSPFEHLPEAGWCDYCGGCCEIRGGLPEFTGPFDPPGRWLSYFRGDACRYQRFCPFLFEYFATAKFFCSVYRVKPQCCWTFDRDECEFLRNEVARERAQYTPEQH